MVLFSSAGSAVAGGEVSLPDLTCESLILTSLQPESVYELNFGGLNVSASPAAVLPGVSAGTERIRTNSKGVLRVEADVLSAIFACGSPAYDVVVARLGPVAGDFDLQEAPLYSEHSHAITEGPISEPAITLSPADVDPPRAGRFRIYAGGSAEFCLLPPSLITSTGRPCRCSRRT